MPISEFNISLTFFVTIFTHIIILPFLLTDSMKSLRILSKACTFSFFFAVVILICSFFLPELFGIEIEPIDKDKIIYFSEKGVFISFGFYMLGYV